MKVRARNLKGKEKMKYLDTLYTSIETLKTREEVKNFLRNLLTESERIMLGRRLIIAQMLLDGKTYAEIMDELKVGIDTINRVHQWLDDENGGYEKAITGIGKIFKGRRKVSDYYDSSMFGQLKRRYPLHFLLFNIFDELNKKK